MLNLETEASNSTRISARYSFLNSMSMSTDIASVFLHISLKTLVHAREGLEYLHKGCNPPLIHRDVKATNILLNEKLGAKIADFGLSKSFNHDTSAQSTNSLVVVGTLGYVDPEYVNPKTHYQISMFPAFCFLG